MAEHVAYGNDESPVGEQKGIIPVAADFCFVAARPICRVDDNPVNHREIRRQRCSLQLKRDSTLAFVELDVGDRRACAATDLFDEPKVVGTIVFPLILIVEPTGQRSDDRA